MTIGEKIKNLRINRKLTFEEISEKTEIKVSDLKKIEKNVIIPTRIEVKKFAKCFEVDEKEIINDETIKETSALEAGKSIGNFLYWIMCLVAFLFFVIIAFIPSLNIAKENGQNYLESFYSLTSKDGNPIVLVSYIFSCCGLLTSSFLIATRYLSFCKLKQGTILGLNLILLVALILEIITIIVVVSAYTANLTSLIN